MASSSSSNKRWNHDVFLSFRGADTRSTFTGHLYQALRHKGVDVFIDNELQRGEVITSQLLRLIEESRISIIVLSEKYASSSFCLDELIKILDCRVSKGQTVIPVFYHVDPTDVEEQRGTFGQEFAKLEAHLNKHFNYWKLFPAKAAGLLRYILRNVSVMGPTVDDLDEERNSDEESGENIVERVQKWRSALTEVARLSGWHLEKGNHESNIIQEIVKKVSRKLHFTPLHVADHPVGLASREEYIIQKLTMVASPEEYIAQKLNMESHNVCMLGLHGMGGVGKTTTARALYNRYASQFEFEGCCFLSKVGENSKNIAELQQTLLSKLLGDHGHLIQNSEEGIELIKRRLRNKKVLIVIDDVDHRKQLQQLVGGLDWFGGGSIIIITTRNSHLLEQHGVTMIHEIKELDFDEALELFSWHAFKEPQPDEAYMELSIRVIRYTRGLPLALIVLGSSLYKRSTPQWDDMLKKLKRNPNKEINDVLKISYDSLDIEEKAIFLDIAFFFKGKGRHEITKFLDVCGFGAHLGIETLVQNSLVYVHSDGTLEIHDLLEAMGAKIALEESSRLCIRERDDILRLFVKDKSAYDVEILVLDLYGEEEVPLKWLQNLTKLRVLAIRNGCFTKMPKKLPNSIRWLEWPNSSLTSISFGFLPPNLFVLEMPCNNAKKFLTEMPKAQKLMNLTRMNLSGSKCLREMVDFSSIPNIEMLDLSSCAKVKRIHQSVGSLEQLKSLNVGGCCSLTSLPNLIDNQCLEFIDITDCSKLETLPDLPTTITQLYMENSGIKEIPFFFGNLINLMDIRASNCKNLVSVSNSIYNLPNIVHIYLNNCPKLPHLPEAESSMFSSNPTSTPTYNLLLSGNKFVSLRINTFKLIHIRWLDLNNCKWLVEIPKLPCTLENLRASNCKSLVRFSQFQFKYFNSDFSNCHKITENEKQCWREMVEGKEDFPSPQRNYYSIILPGNEIPEWFSYAFNCEGIEHSFQLPSSLLNANLIGIAFCSIFQEPSSSTYCKLKFSMNACIHRKVSMNAYFQRKVSVYSSRESEHMWLGFKYMRRPKLSETEEISCKFYCRHSEEVVLKRVGVHFIHKN